MGEERGKRGARGKGIGKRKEERGKKRIRLKAQEDHKIETKAEPMIQRKNNGTHSAAAPGSAASRSAAAGCP
jgi:hypothetical protein